MDDEQKHKKRRHLAGGTDGQEGIVIVLARLVFAGMGRVSGFFEGCCTSLYPVHHGRIEGEGHVMQMMIMPVSAHGVQGCGRILSSLTHIEERFVF